MHWWSHTVWYAVAALCVAAAEVSSSSGSSSIRKEHKGASSSGLYGMDITGRLISIGRDGSLHPLSPTTQTSYLGTPSTIDRRNGVYYLLAYSYWGQNILLGMNLTDGAVVSNCTVPFFQESWPPIAGEILIFVGKGSSVEKRKTSVGDENIFLAGGILSPDGAYNVGWLDSASCKFTAKTVLPPELKGFFTGSYTYNPITKDLFATYLQGDKDNIVVVNMASGSVKVFLNLFPVILIHTATEAATDTAEIAHRSTITTSTNATIDSLDYNQKDGLIYGVGVTAKGERVLSQLNYSTSTGSCNLKVVHSGLPFPYTMGNVATLDQQQQQLAWFGMSANGNVSLVVQSVVDGAVVASHLLCNLCPAFPTQMRYYEPIY